MELQSEQMEAGVDFPLYLSIEAAGLVESWVNGTSWRDLCKETSLDQGDVCRMFRRTVEVLREIPLSYGVPPRIAQLAANAFLKMDRFPVADIDPIVVEEDGSKETVTAGVGFEFAGGRSYSSSSSSVSNGDVMAVEGEVFDDLELDRLLDDDDDGSDDDDDGSDDSDLDEALRGINIDLLDEELDDESALRYVSLEDDDKGIDLIAQLQSMETDVSPRKNRNRAATDRSRYYGSKR